MMQRSPRQALWRGVWQTALLSATVVTLACDGHISTEPIEPWSPGQIQLSMISGNNQSGPAGQPLDAPFVVRVVDRRGDPISGAVVGWDIVEGAGVLPAAPKGPNKLFHETKTDAAGMVSIVLTLGPQSGQNVVTSQVMFGPGVVTFVARGL